MLVSGCLAVRRRVGSARNLTVLCFNLTFFSFNFLKSILGYSAITGNSQHSPGLVWYINGLMSPILYVRRGVTYSFKVEGGSDPTNLRFYNPLYLTTDANGGYAQLDDNTRKTVRVIGGITFDKKSRPTPTAVGRYCVWVSFKESSFKRFG